MQQEEICQILKQIIPELEMKIRMQLKAEYEHKLQQIEKYYQDQIEKLLKKQSLIKAQFESRNSQQMVVEKDVNQLQERITILESQRRNWCSLQIQYQQTISELTNILADINLNLKSNNQVSTPIDNSIANQNFGSKQYSSINAVHPPPKSNFDLCQPYQPKPKENKQMKMSGPISVSNVRTKRSSLNENPLNNQSGIIENSLTKYIKQSNVAEQQQNHNHYHSVLSPPKQEVKLEIRDPANISKQGLNQNPNKGKKMFWDESKKKQLLSLIKLN